MGPVEGISAGRLHLPPCFSNGPWFPAIFPTRLSPQYLRPCILVPLCALLSQEVRILAQSLVEKDGKGERTRINLQLYYTRFFILSGPLIIGFQSVVCVLQVEKWRLAQGYITSKKRSFGLIKPKSMVFLHFYHYSEENVFIYCIKV